MIVKVVYVVVAIAVVMFVTFRKNMKSKLSNVEYAYNKQQIVDRNKVSYVDYDMLDVMYITKDTSVVEAYTPQTSEDVDAAIAYLSEEDKPLISTPTDTNVLVYVVLVCSAAMSLIGLVAMGYAYLGQLK